MKLRGKKITITVGAKLIALSAGLLIATIAVLMYIISTDLVRNNTALIEFNNVEAAGSLGTQTRDAIENVAEKTSLLGRLLLFKTNAEQENLEASFFERDKDYWGLLVFQRQESGEFALARSALSPEFSTNRDAMVLEFQNKIASNKDLVVKGIAESGGMQVSTVALDQGHTAIAVAFPVGEQKASGAEFVFIGLLNQNSLVQNFSRFESVSAFLVDRSGSVVAHANAGLVAARANLSHLEIVKKFLEGKNPNQSLTYRDSKTNEEKLGAYQAVGVGALGVITEVPIAKIYEPVEQIRKRAVSISMLVLSLAFLMAYLFSEAMVRPIRRLSKAAFQISEGDFKINLNVRGNDEISQLSDTFNSMAVHLEHRVRVIETFQKFHNKEIAEKLLSGDVVLGGERRKAVIFFSDIRGFTAMSETLSPEAVVEMLNEYMTLMVSIIRRHNGIVDKFVGDAIMAVWGVPTGTDADAVNAINACLEMRHELAKLNEQRIIDGKAPLKIGMGLNQGDVVAGNIGSNEKMEYTVIGDVVNVASRIESLTKEYDTDLLISSTLKDSVEGSFEFENCESAMVKGKSAAVEIFKVVGKSNTAIAA